ncbi:hypothetical protein BGX27_009532 [Mortierella sp. AM989]|nr:hypothetical protein BGX27_009532 [Mortierella sp. AM989]
MNPVSALRPDQELGLQGRNSIKIFDDGGINSDNANVMAIYQDFGEASSTMEKGKLRPLRSALEGTEAAMRRELNSNTRGGCEFNDSGIDCILDEFGLCSQHQASNSNLCRDSPNRDARSHDHDEDAENQTKDGAENEDTSAERSWSEDYIAIHSSYKDSMATLHYNLCSDLHTRLLTHRHAMRKLQGQIYQEISQLEPLLSDVIHNRVVPKMLYDIEAQRVCCQEVGTVLRNELRDALLLLNSSEGEFKGMERTTLEHDEDDAKSHITSNNSSSSDNGQERSRGIDEDWTLFGWTFTEKPFASWKEASKARRQFPHLVEADVNENANNNATGVEDQYMKLGCFHNNAQIQIQDYVNNRNYTLGHLRDDNNIQPLEYNYNIQSLEYDNNVQTLEYDNDIILREYDNTGEMREEPIVPIEDPLSIGANPSFVPYHWNPPNVPNVQLANPSDPTKEANERTRAAANETKSKRGEHFTTGLPRTKRATAKASTRTVVKNVQNFFQGGVHYHYATAPPTKQSEAVHDEGDDDDGDNEEYPDYSEQVCDPRDSHLSKESRSTGNQSQDNQQQQQRSAGNENVARFEHHDTSAIDQTVNGLRTNVPMQIKIGSEIST